MTRLVIQKPSMADGSGSHYKLVRVEGEPEPMFGTGQWGRWTWWEECGHKESHFSLASAVGECHRLHGFNPHYHGTGGPLTVYKCRWCEWYHIGHLQRKTKQGPNVVYVLQESSVT